MRRGPGGTIKGAQSTGEKAAAAPSHRTRGMKEAAAAPSHRARGMKDSVQLTGKVDFTFHLHPI